MRKLLALLLVCSAVLACDTRLGSGVTVPFTAEIGTYSLQTVSGLTMPVTLAQSSPNTTRQLIADSIFLSGGGGIREVYYVRSITNTTTPPDTAISSFALSGKYTITRDSLGIPADFPYLFGRYSSGVITLTDAQGFVWVFKRP
jgi:hypothetical protein